MLLDFSVSNYLSFKNEVTFSMLCGEASKTQAGKPDLCSLPIPGSADRALKLAVVYGANGSGKSNFVKSIQAMRETVLSSNFNEAILNQLSDQIFYFDKNAGSKPSTFEISFLHNGHIYRYGFEFLDRQITHEWLFRKTSKAVRESYCFRREGKKVEFNPRVWRHANGIDSQTRPDSLYLSACAQFNVDIALSVREWFRDKLVILSGVQNDTLRFTAEQYHAREAMRNDILGFMRQIDSGILDIDITKMPEGDVQNARYLDSYSGMIPKFSASSLSAGDFLINVARNIYDDNKTIGVRRVPFSSEALGTQKAFAFAGPWFDAINNGATLVVDEFGSSLHTKVAMELVKAFQYSKSVQAQLIAITHDTNLLRNDLLRRDQIWFTEKDDVASTDLYSLLEYRTDQSRPVRNDASYGKDYLIGRYGAIPYFLNTEKFLGEKKEDEVGAWNEI